VSTVKTSPAEDKTRFLQSRKYVDSDSSEVRNFMAKALKGVAGHTDSSHAIRLFDAVRDDIRYDPYAFHGDPEHYRASVVATQDAAFCIPKAILLTACLRAAGIPAAVGFADVRNHLNSPKLAELMQTDLFIYHGYVQLWLNGRSYKVTPAFNMELCERFGVKPLVFDGTSDALFHEFDANDRRHMEYVNDRGVFEDAPIEEILAASCKTYPRLMEFVKRERSAAASTRYDAKFAPSASKSANDSARDN